MYKRKTIRKTNKANIEVDKDVVQVVGAGKSISKYGNKKVKFDELSFDSKKERDYYIDLKNLELEKKIENLQLQQRFLLQESFKDRDKKTVREIVYIADFTYNIPGSDTLYVIDVKASEYFQDPVYKIKKKIFIYKYPQHVFKEVY